MGGQERRHLRVVLFEHDALAGDGPGDFRNLDAQHERVQPNRVAMRKGLLVLDAHLIDVGAVGAPEVGDHPSTAAMLDDRVFARGGCQWPHQIAIEGAAERDTAPAERQPHFATTVLIDHCAGRFESHQSCPRLRLKPRFTRGRSGRSASSVPTDWMSSATSRSLLKSIRSTSSEGL